MTGLVVLARLDGKTGLHVLCGMTNERGLYICRGELARVAIITEVAVAFEGRTLIPEERVLCMLDGWKQRARGHWTLNNHSVRLQEVATAAVSRGELAADQLASRQRPRNRRPITRPGGNVFLDVYGLAKDNHVIVLGPKGVLADCPRCGHVNTLTASRLRVARI